MREQRERNGAKAGPSAAPTAASLAAAALTPPRPRSPFPTPPRKAAAGAATSSISVSTVSRANLDRVSGRNDTGSPRRRAKSSAADSLRAASPHISPLPSPDLLSPRRPAGTTGSGDRDRDAGVSDPPALSISPPSSSASPSIPGLSPSPAPSLLPSERSGTPSTTPGTPSRKGKERAAPPTEDAEAAGEVSVGAGDVRRELRELVARAGAEDKQGKERSGKKHKGPKGSKTASAQDVNTLVGPPERTYKPRRYYVLTNAGKPVFTFGHDGDDVTNIMGVAQALISIFAEDDDRLRSVVKGKTRIAFVLKAPLYLFAVSDWGEPEYILRMHLEYINLQILSVVSGAQLSRAFQRRSNFDLSRLLEGTELYLNSLVKRSQYDLSFLTTTLEPLRMAPALRDTAAAALMPPAKFKDLLYVLLIAGGRIVTLLRPRRHTVHPSDMHLLLNTLATSATLRTVETWLPLCLPKFNPAGFVHAYISFIRDDVGLVFISADRDAFEPLCVWRASVEAQLKKDGALDRIEASIAAHAYTVAAVGSPGLRHFIYKSRGLIQVTAPEWEPPYTADSAARSRLLTLYQKVQDALFARSGQAAPLKLVYMATPHEAVLGWLTKPFELYVCVRPDLPMSAVVSTANRVAKWVSSEESRLFLKDAPVF